jgi:hypothetical protein
MVSISSPARRKGVAVRALHRQRRHARQSMKATIVSPRYTKATIGPPDASKATFMNPKDTKATIMNPGAEATAGGR